MALHASPQPVQSSIPPDAYAVDAPSSRRYYSQQSPHLEDSYRSSTSPQSARRSSRQQGGATSQLSNPSTPQQYRSPSASQPSSTSTARAPQMSQAPYTSPTTAVPTTSSPHQAGRREHRNEPDQVSGPPFAPPPRTSSNQRGTSVTAAPTVQLVDRTAPVSQQDRTFNEQRSPREQGQRIYIEDDARWPDQSRVTDDSTTTAAAAARARRRGPVPSEGPQRSASTRDTRAQQSPATIQSRSAANVQTSAAQPTKLSREPSEVINRVVVTDPSVDVAREKERLAEAIPAPSSPSVSTPTALGLVGSEGVDEGGRGGTRQSRQDYSSSAARRKETKFGEYVLGQTLGEGEFGKVKLGWKKDGSVQVAIKLIRRENLNTNPSRLPKIYREIKILSQLSHPNIVRLHEMVETERHIGIILEYASGGELFDYILTHRYLKDNAARRLFAQLVSGVGYLHKKGIVHRDLKLENLLLDRNRNIIITDFGFANTFNPRDELGEEIEKGLGDKDFVKNMGLEKMQDGFRRGDLMQTSCGSPCYAAPELVVTDSLYTGRKVDVWSCGVILVSSVSQSLIEED